MTNNNKYKRVLLKLSGEVLMGEKNFGHDFDIVNRIASEIVEVYKSGVQICVVVGGGNIYRGSNPGLRGNPCPAVLIGMQCEHRTIGQTGGITRLVAKSLERFTVEALETCFHPQPPEPQIILGHRIYSCG